MKPASCRSGFTLIEVMVALTIGALVVLMVNQAFGTAAALSERLDEARRAHRVRLRAEQRLTEAFGSLEAGTVPGSGFEGGQATVEFTTAGDRGQGTGDWTRLTLRVEREWLVLAPAGAAPESLLAAGAVRFEYLLSYGAQASWVREWHSPVSAPLAVRMRLEGAASTDTLLFYIGPRG